MLFIILALLILAGVVYSFIWSFLEEMGDTWVGCAVFGLLTSVLTLCGGALLGGGLLALTSLAVPTAVHETEDDRLRAVSASASIEGRFFLGSGYVNGVRTLNYIVAEDGYSELRQARATDARIYEDESTAPYVTVYSWGKEAWWWMPGVFPVGTTYDFHIPQDSILEDFTIDNT